MRRRKLEPVEPGSTKTYTVRGVEALPVDAVARRVTAPGPKWCEPMGRASSPAAPPGLDLSHSQSWAPREWRRLYAIMDPARQATFDAIFRGMKRNKKNRYRMATCRLLLGLPLSKKQALHVWDMANETRVRSHAIALSARYTVEPNIDIQGDTAA